MMKPLCSAFSIVWIEVPDAPTTPNQPGTRLMAELAVHLVQALKGRLGAAWRSGAFAGTPSATHRLVPFKA